MTWFDILKARGLYCLKHDKGPLDAWYDCNECVQDFTNDIGPNEGFDRVDDGDKSKLLEEDYDENNPEHYREFVDLSQYHDPSSGLPPLPDYLYYRGNEAKYRQVKDKWLKKNAGRWGSYDLVRNYR